MVFFLTKSDKPVYPTSKIPSCSIRQPPRSLYTSPYTTHDSIQMPWQLISWRDAQGIANHVMAMNRFHQEYRTPEKFLPLIQLQFCKFYFKFL